MWDRLFEPVDTLQKGMSAAWLRNSVIRNNIANVETPDFKASEVEFETLFYNSMWGINDFEGKMTRDKHIPIGQREPFDFEPVIVQDNSTSMRMDGNNVDIDNENAKLAQNTLLYNTMLIKMNGELARLKLAISEGR